MRPLVVPSKSAQLQLNMIRRHLTESFQKCLANRLYPKYSVRLAASEIFPSAGGATPRGPAPPVVSALPVRV
jgi:hypothetical protein